MLFLFWTHLVENSVKVVGTGNRDRVFRHILVEGTLWISVLRHVMAYARVVQSRRVLLRVRTSCIWNCVATNTRLNSWSLIYVESALIVIRFLLFTREHSLLPREGVFVLQLFSAVLSILEILSWTWVCIVYILSVRTIELLLIFSNLCFGGVVGARANIRSVWGCLRTHSYRMLNLWILPIETLVHYFNNDTAIRQSRRPCYLHPNSKPFESLIKLFV